MHRRTSVSIYLSQEVWLGFRITWVIFESCIEPKRSFGKVFLRLSKVEDFVAIEWPKRCAYWWWNQTNEFLRKRALYSTFFEACSVDLTQKNQLVKKTWRIDTDSSRLLESLKVCVCDGRHDHLSSKDVSWKETQHYRKKLCEPIPKGLKTELTA